MRPTLRSCVRAVLEAHPLKKLVDGWRSRRVRRDLTLCALCGVYWPASETRSVTQFDGDHQAVCRRCLAAEREVPVA